MRTAEEFLKEGYDALPIAELEIIADVDKDVVGLIEAVAMRAIEQALREAVEECALEAEDYESRDAYGTAGGIRNLLPNKEEGNG